ncbi:hypothetical protein [Acidihalobacter yilgarnensis]|uniref:hypothetical protein n=1 Tax=Acidihalobacter yilgarnensis TaxID=2819280 RepID=UPI0012EA2BDD|nr:hypothetical protein [Acidihalobacter yilgarnensis]
MPSRNVTIIALSVGLTLFSTQALALTQQRAESLAANAAVGNQQMLSELSNYAKKGDSAAQ